MASRPKPSAVMVLPWVRRRSCGVARSTPSLAQIAAHRGVEASDRAATRTGKHEAAGHAIVGQVGDDACAALGNHTRWLAPFLVPGQPSAGTGSPGISHQPSTMCSRRMWLTSPGR